MVVYGVDSVGNLQHAVKKNKLVVVKFGAPWCGFCKTIHPAFEQMSEEKKLKKILFLDVDCGEAKDVAKEEKVSAFPTFKFYRKGKVVDMFAGSDQEKLKKKLSDLISM